MPHAIKAERGGVIVLEKVTARLRLILKERGELIEDLVQREGLCGVEDAQFEGGEGEELVYS